MVFNTQYVIAVHEGPIYNEKPLGTFVYAFFISYEILFCDIFIDITLLHNIKEEKTTTTTANERKISLNESKNSKHSIDIWHGNMYKCA